jgi:hypothetical protein
VEFRPKTSNPALAEFFGGEAGLSASTIQRLTHEWIAEWVAFQQGDLSQLDYVYVWADGVHFKSASSTPYAEPAPRN